MLLSGETWKSSRSQHPPVVSHVTSSRAALGSRTSTTGEAPGGLGERDGEHKHVVSLRSTLLRFFRIRRIDPFSIVRVVLLFGLFTERRWRSCQPEVEGAAREALNVVAVEVGPNNRLGM